MDEKLEVVHDHEEAGEWLEAEQKRWQVLQLAQQEQELIHSETIRARIKQP